MSHSRIRYTSLIAGETVLDSAILRTDYTDPHGARFGRVSGEGVTFQNGGNPGHVSALLDSGHLLRITVGGVRPRDETLGNGQLYLDGGLEVDTFEVLNSSVLIRNYGAALIRIGVLRITDSRLDDRRASFERAQIGVLEVRNSNLSWSQFDRPWADHGQ